MKILNLEGAKKLYDGIITKVASMISGSIDITIDETSTNGKSAGSAAVRDYVKLAVEDVAGLDPDEFYKKDDISAITDEEIEAILADE